MIDAVTVSEIDRGDEPALPQLHPVVVEPHPGVFFSMDADRPAEGDDVVAAGDRLVGVIKLDGDSVVV